MPETATTEVPVANYTDSILDIEDCRCIVRETDSCTSLKDAIFTMFSILGLDEGTPYGFFTLKDLYYSEILDYRNNYVLMPPPFNEGFDATSGGELQLTEYRCMDLMARYYFPTKDTGECRWNYRCTQNQYHFPSFHVEAVLDENASFRCSRITMENRRFIRTQCRLNENLPHWLECYCGRITTGFESRT